MRQAVFRYLGNRFYPVPEFPLAVVTSTHVCPEPIHTHDFSELVIVREGSATHCTDATDEAVRICSGDALLIAQGERHAYSGMDSLVVDNLLFKYDIVASPAESITADAFSVIEPLFHLPILSRTVRLSAVDQQRAKDCIRDIQQELSVRGPGFRGMATSRFLEILVTVGRAARKNMPRPRPLGDVNHETAILAAEEFLRLHFAEPLTLEQVARIANLTPRHFCTVFKRETGLTPWQHLAQLRIAHARFLFCARPAMSVAQVASAAGFSDPAYFARVFRSIAGTTPTKFKAGHEEYAPDTTEFSPRTNQV
jgi:AraC-like DNA-binding protein